MPSAIVIGAGWAGLSCSAHLAHAGVEVTLLDAAAAAGGRAKTIKYRNLEFDNGQHMCIGAYNHLWRLYELLQIPRDSQFQRIAARLTDVDGKNIAINLSNPVLGIILGRGLGAVSKFRLLAFCYAMQRMNFRLSRDQSVLCLLEEYQQTPELITKIWEPIVLATMCTPIASCSAQNFLRVLQQSLFNGNDNSTWYLPDLGLSSTLVDGAINYITQRGGTLHTNCRANAINIRNDQCLEVITSKQSFVADNVIVATAPWHATQLLDCNPATKNLANNLAKFKAQPIVSVYLQYAKALDLKHPISCLHNSLGHWLFAKPKRYDTKCCSVVISGPGQHMQLSKQQVADRVGMELQNLLPELGTPVSVSVFREKKAAFSCEVDIDSIRPELKTPVPGLWLCGDYTQTGLPSTLEGAIMSGEKCAGEVISPRSNQMN